MRVAPTRRSAEAGRTSPTEAAQRRVAGCCGVSAHLLLRSRPLGVLACLAGVRRRRSAGGADLLVKDGPARSAEWAAAAERHSYAVRSGLRHGDARVSVPREQADSRRVRERAVLLRPFWVPCAVAGEAGAAAVGRVPRLAREQLLSSVDRTSPDRGLADTLVRACDSQRRQSATRAAGSNRGRDSATSWAQGHP